MILGVKTWVVVVQRCLWGALWIALPSCTGTVSDPGGPAGSAGGPPTALTCHVGQALCGSTCTDVQANAANCGRCGNNCAAEQICDRGACKSKAQGCSAGLTVCAGGCVELTSNLQHCGGCDQACGADRACVSGACVCVAGKAQCASGCADLASDSSNCGACGNACSGGRSCVNGSCQCGSGRASCGDACVDLQSDPKNCGACSVACGAGKICAAGGCVCAPGQTVCGDKCVDVQSDAANCGSCGVACGLGQACTAGSCGGGGGLGSDGCQGLAQNLTLTEIAGYQTIEVPIMRSGVEVAPAARNSDLVVGRDLLVRLFVSVGSNWSSRELSARLFLQNGTALDTISAKKVITQSSQPGNLDSTFQLIVPKEKVTSDTRYAIEVVECTAGLSGTAGPARFPATDGLALGARKTGTLKLRLVPVLANSLSPDTSDGALASYRSLMLAMYPIEGLEITVATAINAQDPKDWSGMLDQVRAKRQSDQPAADVYYYGMVKPAATLREYCGSACTAGIGFVPQGTSGQQASQRAALGLAFADITSAETMAHEVGHNHGRNHSPCPQTGISGVDPNYPYAAATIGVYGWDPRSQKLLPIDRTDIMGYCNNKWISDYTYDGILNRVASVNGALASEYVDPEQLHPWRVLLLDDRGPRWGIPIAEPSPPAGEAESAQVFDSAGQLLEAVTVYRTEISDIDAYSIQVPEPEYGFHSIRVQGAPPIEFR